MAESCTPLRTGVLTLLQGCRRQGVPKRITSTTRRSNVDPLMGAALDGALAVGPGSHTRRGWLPRVPERADPGAKVGMEDLAFWCRRSAGI